MAKEGITGVYGLKFADGPHNRPVIEALDAGSPAARQGLKVGMEIDEINGVDVAEHSKPAGDAAPSLGCSCFHGSEKPTARELAADAVLRIDKLDFTLRRRKAEKSNGTWMTRPHRKPMVPAW